MKSKPARPMTFGAAAAAGVRLIVWCKKCGDQVEPGPSDLASRDMAPQHPCTIGVIACRARGAAAAPTTKTCIDSFQGGQDASNLVAEAMGASITHAVPVDLICP
jgi:hypothetical protein